MTSVKVAEAHVDIVAKVDKLQTDLNQAHRKIDQFTKEGSANATKLQKSFGSVGTAIKAIGFAAAGAMVASYMKSAVAAASDLEEVTGKFNVVFGEQKKLAEGWAKTLVDSYAMSTREAKQYLSAMQDLLVPMGMNAKAAAEMSNEVVKLAADLGSFNNMPTAKVMEDIQSAMVGNYETMKKYGVVLLASTVQQEALEMGLAATKKELTASHKAMAAYKLIVEGSTFAIGDMARTSDSYANILKDFKADMEDFSASLGQFVIPALKELVKWLDFAIEAMNKWLDVGREGHEKLVLENLTRAYENYLLQWKMLKKERDTYTEGTLDYMKVQEAMTASWINAQHALETLHTAQEEFSKEAKTGTEVTNNLGGAAGGAAPKIDELAKAIKRAEQVSSDFARELKFLLDSAINPIQEAEMKGWAQDMEDAYKKVEKVAEETTEELGETWTNMLKDMQSGTSSVIKDIIKGVDGSFENLFDRIFDYFIDMLADMLAAAAMRKIVIPVLFGVQGQGGLLPAIGQKGINALLGQTSGGGISDWLTSSLFSQGLTTGGMSSTGAVLAPGGGHLSMGLAAGPNAAATVPQVMSPALTKAMTASFLGIYSFAAQKIIGDIITNINEPDVAEAIMKFAPDPDELLTYTMLSSSGDWDFGPNEEFERYFTSIMDGWRRFYALLDEQGQAAIDVAIAEMPGFTLRASEKGGFTVESATPPQWMQDIMTAEGIGWNPDDIKLTMDAISEVMLLIKQYTTEIAGPSGGGTPTKPSWWNLVPQNIRTGGLDFPTGMDWEAVGNLEGQALQDWINEQFIPLFGPELARSVKEQFQTSLEEGGIWDYLTTSMQDSLMAGLSGEDFVADMEAWGKALEENSAEFQAAAQTWAGFALTFFEDLEWQTDAERIKAVTDATAKSFEEYKDALVAQGFDLDKITDLQDRYDATLKRNKDTIEAIIDLENRRTATMQASVQSYLAGDTSLESNIRSFAASTGMGMETITEDWVDTMLDYIGDPANLEELQRLDVEVLGPLGLSVDGLAASLLGLAKGFDEVEAVLPYEGLTPTYTGAYGGGVPLSPGLGENYQPWEAPPIAEPAQDVASLQALAFTIARDIGLEAFQGIAEGMGMGADVFQGMDLGEWDIVEQFRAYYLSAKEAGATTEQLAAIQEAGLIVFKEYNDAQERANRQFEISMAQRFASLGGGEVDNFEYLRQFYGVEFPQLLDIATEDVMDFAAALADPAHLAGAINSLMVAFDYTREEAERLIRSFYDMADALAENETIADAIGGALNNAPGGFHELLEEARGLLTGTGAPDTLEAQMAEVTSVFMALEQQMRVLIALNEPGVHPGPYTGPIESHPYLVELNEIMQAVIQQTIDAWEDQQEQVAYAWRDVIKRNTLSDLGYQLAELNDWFLDLKDSAEALGETDLLEQALQIQAQDIIDNFLQPIKDAWAGFQQNMLTSTLAPVQSMEALKMQYATLFAAAQAGDVGAYQDLLDFVQNQYMPFLQAFSAGDYANIWQGIMDDLGQLTFDIQQSATDSLLMEIRDYLGANSPIYSVLNEILGALGGSARGGASSPSSMRQPIAIQVEGKTIAMVVADELNSGNTYLTKAVKRVM